MSEEMTPTTYRLPWSRYQHVTGSRTEISATKFYEDRPVSWAIREGGSVLAKDGEWEIEPSPSNRDDDFIERTRWRTAEGAFNFARKHFTP